MTYRNYSKVSGIIQPWQPEGIQILFYLEFKLSTSTASSHFTLHMEEALQRTLFFSAEPVAVLHIVVLEIGIVEFYPLIIFFLFPSFFILSFLFPRIIETITEELRLKETPIDHLVQTFVGKGA